MELISTFVIAGALAGASAVWLYYRAPPPSRLTWRRASASEVGPCGFPRSIFGLWRVQYWKHRHEGLTVFLGVKRERDVDSASHGPSRVRSSYRLCVDASKLLPKNVDATFQADALGDDPLPTALFARDLDRLDRTDYVSIHEGYISMELVRDRPLYELDDLVLGLLQAALRAGRACTKGQIDVLSLLLANMEDDHPGVRERSLRVLVSRYPEESALKAVLQNARTDPSPGVRLIAAVRANDRALLEELVEEESANPSVRRTALVRLFERFPDDRTFELTMRSLASGCEDLIRAALQQLAERGTPIDPAPLVEIAKMKNPLLAVEALRTIERLLGERAEPILVDFITDRDPEIQIAAIDALGRVGTVASVERLRKEESVFASPELSVALTTAIELIQSRARGAGGGMLSLADGEEGRLSIPDATGALSEPKS